MQRPTAFGLIVIGDELLSGKRQDKHLPHVIRTLAARDLQLAWCRLLGDDRESLVVQLRQTRDAGLPVLVFGGIGATPDDNTRAAAALAFDRPLERHAGAARLIERQFGAEAYPKRILMADLPGGCSLIPNGYNNIPGFSLEQHHFLPGFPQMAWPMLDWLLATVYVDMTGNRLHERSVRVYGVRESDLVEMMEELVACFPGVKLFSLPHLGQAPSIEIGFRGPPVQVDEAWAGLCEVLDRRGCAFGKESDPA